MAWIESHQSLATHRKTKALQRLLKINRVRAIGHLHLLWWWCLDNAPDGNLSDIDAADIADAADWTGNPQEFLEALILSGFVDNDIVGVTHDIDNDIVSKSKKLHDWDDYAGKFIQRRAVNRERMRAIRATHVQGTSTARAEPPYHTVPESNNTTIPVVPVTRTTAIKTYEENIGMITAIIANQLKDAEKTYPEGWVTDAIKEAVTYNKRNWAYIDTILRRWSTEGRGNGHKPGGNGHGNNGGNHQTTDAERRAGIEELLADRAKV